MNVTDNFNLSRCEQMPFTYVAKSKLPPNSDEKGEGVNQRSSFINDANSRLLNSRQLSLDSPRTFEEQGSLPSQKQPKIVNDSIYTKGITKQENAQNTSKPYSLGINSTVSPLKGLCKIFLFCLQCEYL